MLKCRCECGKEVNVAKSKVVNGKATGCRSCVKIGIRIESQWKPAEDIVARKVYADYKRRAERKGVSFDLSREVFKTLMYQPCFYCNEEGSNYQALGNREGGAYYNGIDRRVPADGYVGTNVLTCCKYCNRMKSDLTHDEFFERINLLAAKWGERPVIVQVPPAMKV
jgi:hypothetical protein